MVYKLRKSESSLHLYDYYILLSFISAAVLWFSLYLHDELFILNSFFESSLVVGSYFFFLGHYGKTKEYKLLNSYPLFFLFQSICFIGMTFKLHTLSGLYMALIPCVLGTLFFMYRENRGVGNNERKGLFLYLMGACTFLFFGTVRDLNFISYNDASLFLIFSLWVMGIVYSSNDYLVKDKKSLIGLLLKRGQGEGENTKNKKDRLFFHDIINHTHGVSLFLNGRIHSGRSIDRDDLFLLSKEVKMIQSLIKDHYGYKHKNLVAPYNVVSFDFAKIGVLNLVENFLPDSKVQSHFIFKGGTASECPMEIRQKCVVYYPTFYRVMNNIIKNIAEAKSELVEFVFDYNEHGLYITVKNKITFLESKSRDGLEKDLGNIILLDEKERDYGMGIESVSSLVENVNGSFKFKIEDGYWINEVFLPIPRDMEVSRAS